jgi:hypothetical protein
MITDRESSIIREEVGLADTEITVRTQKKLLEHAKKND